jgi:hypothetical protein
MTERPTEKELDQIRDRLANATAAPWKTTWDNHRPIVGPPKTTRKGGGIPKPVPNTEIPVVHLDNTAACGDPDCCSDNPYVGIAPADARFIADARQDIPKLLTEVEALRDQLRTVENERDEQARLAHVAYSSLHPQILARAEAAERDLATATAALERLRKEAAQAHYGMLRAWVAGAIEPPAAMRQLEEAVKATPSTLAEAQRREWEEAGARTEHVRLVGVVNEFSPEVTEPDGGLRHVLRLLCLREQADALEEAATVAEGYDVPSIEAWRLREMANERR